ncbi:MAG TPA: hypothetical protein VGB91_07250 [Rhizomicrobium sp.]
MRRILSGAAVLLALSGPALAADDAATATDPMSPLYGNTLVIIDAKGLESHTVYNADHTFTGVVPAFSYKYQGTWEITTDGQICSTFVPPPPGVTNPRCSPMGIHAVGDSWSTPDGGKGSLVAGVQ